MANKEHLDKLQEGVEAWNVWRAQHPAIQPDLRRANLRGVNLLRVVDFGRADLGGANLIGANLEGADFAGADLSWAYFPEDFIVGILEVDGHGGAILIRTRLVGASFHGVNLTGAIFDGTDLSGASFHEANLAKAVFNGANLSGADLTRAKLYKTIFANVDLTNVKGLDFCEHAGPSTIDHRTLERSSMLPLSFLRGCGLPDTFIDYLPSLLNQPIQYYSCFISYASKNDDFVQRLYADLQNKGVRCWFAPEDLKIGDKWRVRIDEAIRTYEKLLLLLSAHSVASTWVEKEVETAFDRENERGELVLFPIRLDSAVMESKTGWAADIRRSRHIGDFCNWKNHDDYQKGLERLLRDLKIEKGK